jgi:hypothetical protein
MSLEAAVTQFRLFQELFILLTDSEYTLDWPIIQIDQGTTFSEYTLYFWRQKTPDEPPADFTCPTNFLQLRENFGAIVSQWLHKRERFGPGFYLYLGVRRGFKLYSEHRFVNLIWGLEALHRKRTEPEAIVKRKLKDKVHRIVEQITLPKDKRWLKCQLERTLEPSLEERICEVIDIVPIKLNRKSVRAYAKRCADLRNDISHFGAQRRQSSYKEFLEEVKKASDALEIIYHMLILHEIGIDEGTLRAWLHDGFHSFRNKRYLVAAGLLDSSVLTPDLSRP